jgi:cobalamin biosynthesis Mg chelatase CobN
MTSHLVYRYDLNKTFMLGSQMPMCLSLAGTGMAALDVTVLKYLMLPTTLSCEDYELDGKKVKKLTLQGTYNVYTDENGSPVAVEALSSALSTLIPTNQICRMTFTREAPMEKFTFDKTSEAGCADQGIYEANPNGDCTIVPSSSSSSEKSSSAASSQNPSQSSVASSTSTSSSEESDSSDESSESSTVSSKSSSSSKSSVASASTVKAALAVVLAAVAVALF